MARLKVYLPQGVEDKIRHVADAEGMSISRWVTRKVLELVDQTWPREFRELAGAFPEFPGAEEFRESYRGDVAREKLD